MTEQELLVDCLQRLNRLSAAYMLTGSMASNYWGLPRTTHDIDFVVHFPPAYAPQFSAAFADGFGIDEFAIRQAYNPPYQFNAIDTRSAIKVDFWMLRPDPFEENAFSRRVKKHAFGEEASLATAEDVILHKLRWNAITPSQRQLNDAAGVVIVQGAALDLDYLRTWALKIGADAMLERVLAGEFKPKVT